MLLPHVPRGTVVNATVRLLGALLACCETTRAFAPYPWSPSSADIIPISKCSREHTKLIHHPHNQRSQTKAVWAETWAAAAPPSPSKSSTHAPQPAPSTSAKQTSPPISTATLQASTHWTSTTAPTLSSPAVVPRAYAPPPPPSSPKSKRINHNIRATTSMS